MYERIFFVKKILIFTTCLIGYAASVCAGSASVPAELFETITGHILQCRYGDAENAADDYIAEYPGEPVGPLLKASVLQYESIDYEDFSRDSEFDVLLDHTERLARIKIRSDSDDLWARYFLYAADGLRGARASLAGQFVYGVLKGRSGKIGMEKIIAEDPTFYDAYLLVGSYRFWKSVAIGPAVWLPFMSDESARGISEVNTAIYQGIIAGPLSYTVIIEMYLASDPSRAAVEAEKMLERYPSCRLFAWQLGEAYKKLERFDEAERIFTGIAESMRGDAQDDGSGEVRSWWKLAVIAKTVGKTDKCLYYCKKIVNYPGKNGKSVFDRQRDRIGKARDMIEDMEHE